MLCALSGESAQVPVASRKSGVIYERRLIEAYILENETEPGTGELLSVEDLIELKSPATVRPRPPSLTSIPSLLGVFQEEWDALALETYTLRQNLAQARQELSAALYQHDAAVRVIARLTKERDSAREALAKINVGRADTHGANGEAMQLDSAPLPDAIIAKIENSQESLSKTRRKRPVPEGWTTSDNISKYLPKTHSKPLYPGGTTLAVHESGDLVLVGGLDGSAGVYSTSEKRLLQTIKGDGGSICSGLWAGTRTAISTTNGKVKIFASQEEIGSFQTHAGAATAISLHPSGDLLASVGEDKTYAIYDLQSMNVLTQVSCDSGLTCTQFHPDGHLLAAGAEDGQVKIFDVKSGAQAAAFEVGGQVKAICFSENGIWLAVIVHGSSVVSIWDLRKSSEVNNLTIGTEIESISWDYTGQFLAAAGPGGITVEQYVKASKDWTRVLQLAIPAKHVVWGNQARHIVALDSDGVVTVLGE